MEKKPEQIIYEKSIYISASIFPSSLNLHMHFKLPSLERGEQSQYEAAMLDFEYTKL